MLVELLSLAKAARRMQLPDARNLVFCLVIFSFFAIPSVTRASSLSAKEAQKRIARVAGFALKNGAVHVKRVSAVDSSTMDATAEIEIAFRFEQNDQAQWRVAEVRSGQDNWEEIAFVLKAVKGELNPTACEQPDLASPKQVTTGISTKRARCLVANLLGVQLPSDAVRIKSVSPLGLPLVSHQSALVDARIEVDFRFARDKNSWRVSLVKTGARGWADPEAILLEVNREKAARAQTELQAIAGALERFRSKRGFYVDSKNEAVLIDLLSPLYLSTVIRLDPWRRPYRYEGTHDHFSLRSCGPDGKENTDDDVVLESHARMSTEKNEPLAQIPGQLSGLSHFEARCLFGASKGSRPARIHTDLN